MEKAARQGGWWWYESTADVVGIGGLRRVLVKLLFIGRGAIGKLREVHRPPSRVSGALLRKRCTYWSEL